MVKMKSSRVGAGEIWPVNLCNEILNEDHGLSSGYAEIAIDYLLSTRTRQEKEIILSLYKDYRTFTSTGRDHGISGNRVRRICDEVLREMQKTTRQKFLLVLTEQLGLAHAEENVGVEKYKQPVTGDGDNPDDGVFKPAYIEDLALNLRCYNCLKRAGINTLDELKQKSITELEGIRSMGIQTLCEIISVCEKHGIRLGTGRQEQ